MGKRSAVVELFLGDMGSMQRELRPLIKREDQPPMETKLEQIAVKAVTQLPKSVVREIRTPRSVGTGGGRPPPVTRCLDLLVVRVAERVEALDLDLDLEFVMGSSEGMRRHPPHHLSPARAKTPAGQDQKRAFATSSHHSNAPIEPVSQSNLSKIVALLTAIAARIRSLRRTGRLLLGPHQRGRAF